MARPETRAKEVLWPELATWFDHRRPPDKVAWGRWKYILNSYWPEAHKLSRFHGWKPLTVGPRVEPMPVQFQGHPNSDLRDQLLAHVGGWKAYHPNDTGQDITSYPPKPGECDGPISTGGVGKEPITSLYLHTSPTGQRQLFAGTQSRIYVQRGDGGWRLLADLKGGTPKDPGVRFRFASLLNTVVAVNGVDPPLFHIICTSPTGCEAQAFHGADELNTLGVLTANVVASWKGVVFLADVFTEGARVGHRIMWCNTNAPFEWGPSDDSIAGFQDLDPGERIMAAVPLADALYFLTDRSIWRCAFAPENTFSFQQVYAHRQGQGCIKAPHSVAVWKDIIIYWAGGTLVVYSPFTAAPQVADWMDGSTSWVPKDADCRVVTAGMWTSGDDYNVFVLSWPDHKGGLNTRTLVYDLDKQASSLVDHGMSALLTADLKPEQDMPQWLVANGLCTQAEVNEMWPLVKEDTRYYLEVMTPPPGEPMFTYKTIKVVVDGDELVVEDYTYPPYVPAGKTTVCTRLTDADFRCAECVLPPRFIFASASDYALKEWDTEYFARDQYANVHSDLTTAYGYATRWLSGAVDLGRTDQWKRLFQVNLLLQPMATDIPRAMKLRVGVSGIPVDPLNDNCRIRWTELTPKPVACSEFTEGQPNEIPMQWNLIVEGRYLYFDFNIEETTGGAFHASNLSITVVQSPATAG